MTVLGGAESILRTAGKPLHCREIADRMVANSLWQTAGKTPWDTVSARLAVDIQKHAKESRFQRTSKGVFALRAWKLPEFMGPVRKKAPKPEPEPELRDSNDSAPSVLPAPPDPKPLSFADAAAHVLKESGNGKPMHYRDITRLALTRGLIATTGKTPESTLYAVVLTEIERYTLRGQTPRFVKHGRGYVGLAAWSPLSIAAQIDHANRQVRSALLDRLRAMPPAEFEELIGNVLGEIGFEEISKTSYTHDGGIDLRGTMVVGGVIRTNMAVQVKRWKANVQAPTVQQVRGSLGTHEQGLIITTANFSKGAHEEANRANAVPVAIMNGEQLVAVMVEHGIGVGRQRYDLLSLPLHLQPMPSTVTTHLSAKPTVEEPEEEM